MNTITIKGERVTESDLAAMSVPAFAEVVSLVDQPVSTLVMMSGVYKTITIDDRTYTASPQSWERMSELCFRLWQAGRADVGFYQGGCAYLIVR